MPPLPLVAVKAAVDVALPTPAQAWVGLTYSESLHHPHESGEFNVTFNGRSYRFYGGCERSGADLIWHVSKDDAPNISRVRQGIVSDAATWDSSKGCLCNPMGGDLRSRAGPGSGQAVCCRRD